MKKTVILIEDDVDACMLISRVLTDAGYEVCPCHEGSALLNTDSQRFDLYILDNCLPRIDGVALTKFLKVKDGTRHLPVVVLSGNRSIARKARQAGASAFIEKPFDVTHFLQVVHGLVSNNSFRYFPAEDTEPVFTYRYPQAEARD